VLDRSASPAPAACGLSMAEHLVDQFLVFGCPLGSFYGLDRR
jgi:hypothetical protein